MEAMCCGGWRFIYHYSVVSGVPQGSVLGSLRFLIYINHVSSLTLTDGSKLTMYADNILLYKPINSHEEYNIKWLANR